MHENVLTPKQSALAEKLLPEIRNFYLGDGPSDEEVKAFLEKVAVAI